MKKISRVLYLSLFAQILCASGEIEVEQCQICLESGGDLRQVCGCIHNLCVGCLQRLVDRAPTQAITLLCPNCRRAWDLDELVMQCELTRRGGGAESPLRRVRVRELLQPLMENYHPTRRERRAQGERVWPPRSPRPSLRFRGSH